MEFLGDNVWDFRVVRSKFGVGAISEIGYDVKALGSKVLIVTDPGIAKAGLVDKVKKYLEEQKLEVYMWDQVEPEPSLESMEEGVKFAKEINADCFIGLGGGSAMDTEKVINLIATYGGEILDYVAPPTGGGKRVPGPVKPHVAIPTTSGTGSETSPASVITLPKQKLKVGVSSDLLRPTLAVLDPMMTVNCPPSVTASAGMDALSHAIGSYTTRRFDQKTRPKTPMERPPYGGGTELTDTFALKAIEMLGCYLRRAVYQGLDIEARSKVQLASFYAGVAFTNTGVIADHAMAYPLGGEFHVPHGLSCALLLPAVMEYNLPGNYEKSANIARALGEDVAGLSVVEAAARSVNAVKKLSKDIRIPSGLEAIGAREEHIPRMAKDTLKVQRLLVGNPRPVTEEDLANIFRAAMRNY